MDNIYGPAEKREQLWRRCEQQYGGAAKPPFTQKPGTVQDIKPDPKRPWLKKIKGVIRNATK